MLAGAAPPVHLTPVTRDRELARRWFELFEGAGLDGLIAKAPDSTYQPNKRVMVKVKHVRTADCVVAGYRVHKSGPGAIGSLLLGLYRDEAAPPAEWEPISSGLAPVGVVAAFPMARRRELFEELQPLVTGFDGHPWHWAGEHVEAATRGMGSRWNPDKSLSFVPLRPERVVEVRYDHMEGSRFRHPPQFVRWRPDRDARVVRLRAARAAGALRPRRRAARRGQPVGVAGSPSAAAASLGTNSSTSSGMLSTLMNEVASYSSPFSGRKTSRPSVRTFSRR